MGLCIFISTFKLIFKIIVQVLSSRIQGEYDLVTYETYAKLFCLLNRTKSTIIFLKIALTQNKAIYI